MIDELREIRESQIRMEADLKYHIKRTDLLESDLDARYGNLSREIDRLDADVIILKQPLSFMAVMKIAGAVSTMVSIVLMLLKYLKGI
jgi:hypothetical protein